MKWLLSLILSAGLLTNTSANTSTDLALLHAELAKLQKENQQLQQQLKESQTQIPQFQLEFEPFFDRSTTLIFSKNDEQIQREESIAEASLLVIAPKTDIKWLKELLYREIIFLLRSTDTENRGGELILEDGKAGEKLHQILNAFYDHYVEKAKQRSHQGFHHTVRTDYLGMRNNRMSFLIHFTNYEAEQIITVERYVHIDINTQKIINLDTLFTHNDQQKLRELLWHKAEQQALQMQMPLNMDKERFRVPDNFYFYGGGLVFVYSPIEALSLYWDEVNHLLKPQYQRSLKDGFIPPAEEYR